MTASQCRFVNHVACAAEVRHVRSGGGGACVGRGTQELPEISAQFCSTPKTALKQSSLLMKKKKQMTVMKQCLCHMISH